MNNNRKNQKKRKRSIVRICLAVCLVAVLAIAGTYMYGNDDTQNSQASADQEDTGAADAATDLSDAEDEETSSEQVQNESADAENEEADSAQKHSQTDTGSGETQNEDATNEVSENAQSNSVQTEETSAAAQTGLSLEWPVEGNVLMSYSMDKTVYFKTLNEYKYNPAMIIGGEEGAEVSASATGTVSSVGVTAQTGTTVTMNIGSGYSVVYGQLKEVNVSEGDYLDTGDSIGYLSAPTKYYTEEGCNLYYQVLKNGQPVDPLDFLEEE